MRGKQQIKQFLSYYTKNGLSQLGLNVALFMEGMWGLHHIRNSALDKIDWSNDWCIEYIHSGYLSTIDGNNLTRLVVIAHQMMLRVEINGCGPGYIKMMFHQRNVREGRSIDQRCPHIIDHVRQIMEYHPAVDEVREEILGDV